MGMEKKAILIMVLSYTQKKKNTFLQEKSTLKKLSSEYLSWLHQGGKKDCPVPYVANAPTKEHLSQVANSLLAGFMSMAEAGNKSSGLGKIKK